jgi:hypothetical protein
MKHLGIFINDTNSELKYKINLNNFNKLKHNFNNIIIFDNKSEYAYNLNNYIKDNHLIYKYLLANIGKDNNDINIEKLNYILKDINSELFDYITVINDNYIYIDSLQDYFDYIKKHNSDFYSYTDSSEHFYHFQLYLFTFKSSYLNKVVNNLESFNYNDKLYILNNFTSIFKNKISYLKIAYLDDNYQQNIYINDKLYKIFLENNIIKVIYLNKINHIIDNYKNEIFINIPKDFDVNIYKNHNDLKNFTENALIDHFLNNGQFEARNYTKEFYILPNYIRNALFKCNDLIYIIDLPKDFNLYNYKEKNMDLSNLNRTELLIHYIKFGRYEKRSY